MIRPAARVKRLRVSLDQPGRYDMVLLADRDDIASQPLLIGPAEVFRGEA